MSISVKLNKNGIKKLQKELEQEMKKRTIVREGVGLRKDIEFGMGILEAISATFAGNIIGIQP